MIIKPIQVIKLSKVAVIVNISDLVKISDYKEEGLIEKCIIQRPLKDASKLDDLAERWNALLDCDPYEYHLDLLHHLTTPSPIK
jgi:hypothetical protein